MTTTTAYPYSADDRVMVGIVTWNHPKTADNYSAQGPSGPTCRYFITATVVANDREAGRIVVRMDDTDRIDVYHAEDFDCEEIVAYDDTLPTTPGDAQHRALFGEIH
jgi:hypothetical protein